MQLGKQVGGGGEVIQYWTKNLYFRVLLAARISKSDRAFHLLVVQFTTHWRDGRIHKLVSQEFLMMLILEGPTYMSSNPNITGFLSWRESLVFILFLGVSSCTGSRDNVDKNACTTKGYSMRPVEDLSLAQSKTVNLYYTNNCLSLILLTGLSSLNRRHKKQP